MEENMQETLSELYAIRAVMSLLCNRYPTAAEPVTGTCRRRGGGENSRSLRFSSWLCFWKRLRSNVTNFYLLSLLSGFSSAFYTVLDFLFPILQIAAAVLLAVFGAVGMLDTVGLLPKILFILLVFSPLLLRLFICVAVSIREIKKYKADFFAYRKSAEEVYSLLAYTEKIYPLIRVCDWGKVDLLIYLLERGSAANIRAAMQAAECQTEAEGLAEAVKNASAEIAKTAEVSIKGLGSVLEELLSRWREGTETDSLYRALRDKISVPSTKLAKWLRDRIGAKECL